MMDPCQNAIILSVITIATISVSIIIIIIIINVVAFSMSLSPYSIKSKQVSLGLLPSQTPNIDNSTSLLYWQVQVSHIMQSKANYHMEFPYS